MGSDGGKRRRGRRGGGGAGVVGAAGGRVWRDAHEKFGVENGVGRLVLEYSARELAVMRLAHQLVPLHMILGAGKQLHASADVAWHNCS